MQKIKTVFLGSNWEALATLKTLTADVRFELVCVITQPDKPVGRKKVITPNEIKVFAESAGIPVVHTESDEIRYREVLEKYRPELVVCKSFGEIIPEFFLVEPEHGAINVHFSLLPKYRGAVPIQMAILNGDETTGISIVKMVAKLDAGPILTTVEENVLPTDTNQSLRERLVQKSVEILPDILQKWCAGKIDAVEQDHDKATFCKQSDISKESAEIRWASMEPVYIERMVRAFIPWPVAWCIFNGRRLKVFTARLIDNSDGEIFLSPGEFKAQEERLFVGTKDPNWLIQLLEVQIEGRNRMTGGEFARGQDL